MIPKPFAWTLLVFIALSCQEITSQTVRTAITYRDTTKKPEVSSFDTPVLQGTTVLTASEKNLESRWVFGLYLDSIYASPCSRPSEETPSPTEITSLSLINDS